MTETLAPAAGAYAARPVAEIAASLPGATAVFRRHKLDFCCGGQAPLAEAAAARGADLGAVEAELAALMPGEAAAPEATEDLITLIETRYHATHRRELPELVRLARRVEAVHGDRAEAPHGLADLLSEIGVELEEHMQKEEQVLFPLMRRGGHPMIGHPIGMMRHEHDSHGAQLRALDALTTGGVPPEGACNTWRALYAGTRKLTDDLMEHIHLENNVLFPRFGA
ncbi:iron-sulfur cluster repair protein YtfE [Belnapia rosea]|uniref:Regulator of cell morphogenesis and NO signaling n=1 Tax=Belnapia rosea TaxID=938405 RepID=A0A1G7BF75_9PROT|nr:iron-sulfur cluster repair protein YtfE [Belnapia rosea]SDE25731.1 regulator of cell morphogenesis and NO signaling [Belnapia rosea]